VTLPSLITRDPPPARVTRDQGRRVEHHYVVSPRTPGLVLALRPPRPSVALVVQFGETLRAGGALRRVLSVSAAASFGLRDPDVGATVVTMMPTEHAPVTPKLPHLLALLLREAACLPERFRESGMDVFLLAPDTAGVSTGAAFGLTMSRAGFPRGTALRVPDLAGHGCKLALTLHDLTPLLSDPGLPRMQFLAGTSRPGPRHVGDVGQNLSALLDVDPGEYRRVAGHQAELALAYACELHDR